MNHAPTALPTRIEQAFRRGRIRVACDEGLLALGLLVPAVLWSAGGGRSILLAAVALMGLVALVYRGGEAARFAFPAVTLGMIPLACALLAPGFGHFCGPDGCYSFFSVFMDLCNDLNYIIIFVIEII